LTHKTIKVGSNVYDSSIKLVDCNANRESLSKALYDKLFTWLCAKLNKGIMPEKESDISNSLSIGLLDIFGFENFVVNSFEQFCINYTNEHL
jgi:myosin heavy subunit